MASGSPEVSPGLRSRPSLSEGVGARQAAHPGRVSPGLRSRPSLSDSRDMAREPIFLPRHQGVAGTTVPAFVEREGIGAIPAVPLRRVSPGLRSRPSLSVIKLPVIHAWRIAVAVSPGLRSRPSLSALTASIAVPDPTDVVSPGLRSRPSLSVRDLSLPADHGGRGLCRRDYGPGLR